MLYGKSIKTLIDQERKRLPEEHPWAEFDEQITVSFALQQEYRHSLGRYSRFFCELANGRFFATRCPKCDRVYAPPRTLCLDCQSIPDWVELSGKGTVKTFSVLHFNAGIGADVKSIHGPIFLVYVLLDGGHTLFPHLLRCAAERLAIGLRVKPQYVSGPVSHPLHLMHFVPEDEVL
ncbi:MAG: OB-fold domain-containing protein [Chloroflexi bacterium]|nr:OB-fold domain-containing protein [Chloroflexota bacterium]